MSHRNYLDRTLEFHKKYNEDILPLFKTEEEPHRITEEEGIKIYRIIVAIILVVVLGVGILLGRAIKVDELPYVSYLFGILVSFPIILTALSFDCFNLKAEKNYKTYLKEYFLDRILYVFGNIKWHQGTKVIPSEELDRSGLFPMFHDREVDDSYTGIYNGVNFKISEEKLFIEEKGRDSEIGTRIPLFRGCVLIFDTNKEVLNRTIVATKSSMINKNSHLSFFMPFAVVTPFALVFFYALWDILGLKGLIIDSVFIALVAVFLTIKTRIHIGEKMEYLHLEDLKFGEMFASYSSDQVEGRYLITPAFMERLLNLKTVFGTKKIKCSFYDNKLMIAIETNKDLFEIGDLHTSLEDSKCMNNFYNEISSILRMVDYFKLDENTGL